MKLELMKSKKKYLPNYTELLAYPLKAIKFSSLFKTVMLLKNEF